ncbi:alpha/beta hydrolase [Amycolatopsis sp. NBC_00345]|uniref:alpha/beta fold hydrolase n=1 Tax=Amycolatopsis sp. NBC_00345 TaxID=2975955 RepID=UPI002E2737AF
MTPVPYRRGSVRSADGTVLGYRELGGGPGLVVLHGGMLAAQSMMKLAEGLSGDFTVYVPDRRGRGASGPHGPDYGVAREVEDVQALLTETGAAQVFGLSSGALVTLRTALETPAPKRIALYEPPLSVRGSMPMEWLARFDREIAAGRVPAALATALKGMDVDPLFSRVPRFVLAPMMALALRLQRTAEGDVPIAALVPTQHFDLALVRELADTQRDYAAVPAEVLLLGGGKSPAYLKGALDELAAVLPHAHRVTFPRLDHSAPSDDGDPARVAQELREFFRS